MNAEPTAQEIEDKLIEMAYVWGDIETEVVEMSTHYVFRHNRPEITEDEGLVADLARYDATHHALNEAFRVEAVYGENGWGDPCVFYVLLYDVTDSDSRERANDVESDALLRQLIRDKARPWHSNDFLTVKRVTRGTAVEGQVCRRFGEKHPVHPTPTLDDVPISSNKPGGVELVDRDGYLLTPIEAPFFDALRETGLTFSVQPWIQGPDGKYRLDFLVFYDGGALGVELDGHEWHKTKEQRSRDTKRDRWFLQRKIQMVRFTGTQVFADVQGCVSELLNVVRASQARP